MIEPAPVGRVVVEQVEVPVVIGWVPQPATGVPLRLKLTVPAEGATVAGAVGEVVAVKVTDWPAISRGVAADDRGRLAARVTFWVTIDDVLVK